MFSSVHKTMLASVDEYTVSLKKGATLTIAITLSILDAIDLQNSFIAVKSSKFPTNLY